MWHDKILEQREIFGGEVLCVINSVIMFDFSIPRQTVQKQGRFFVQEVSHVFDSFK